MCQMLNSKSKNYTIYEQIKPLLSLTDYITFDLKYGQIENITVVVAITLFLQNVKIGVSNLQYRNWTF